MKQISREYSLDNYKAIKVKIIKRFLLKRFLCIVMVCDKKIKTNCVFILSGNMEKREAIPLNRLIINLLTDFSVKFRVKLSSVYLI